MTKIDCKNLRITRQKENDISMCLLLETGNGELVKQLCNINELNRVLKDLDITLDQLLYKCYLREWILPVQHIVAPKQTSNG